MLLSICLSPSVVFAQNSPGQIIRYRTVATEKTVPGPGAGTYLVSAPYGKPVLSAATLDEIKKQQVLSVELVYTRFRRSEKFDQTRLNLQRLENLQRILPQVFADNKVDWQLTEQTGAADFKTGQTYFHGFIIRTRKSAFTAKDREAELSTLAEEAKTAASASKSAGSTGTSTRERNTSAAYDTEPIKYYETGPVFGSDPCELPEDVAAHLAYPAEASIRNISGRIQAQITVNRAGGVQDIKITEGMGFGCDLAVKEYLKTMPVWKPAKTKAGNVNAYVTLNFWFAMDESKIPASEMPCDLVVVMPKDKKTDGHTTDESNRVVSEIFSRQKDWNQVAVVCDVTASMGPYMGDLLKWFRLNQGRIKHFTFFNDGDMAPDSRKAIGSTGGIYHSPDPAVEAVETEMYRAMRGGWGGDLPENDVEALLEAENNAPFAQRLVWIADNYATPRDLTLLPRITKPVSIVICSVQGGVNPDLLNAARKLKATLHTLYTDLPDISGLKDGERVTVDERQYELVNGKFVRIY